MIILPGKSDPLSGFSDVAVSSYAPEVVDDDDEGVDDVKVGSCRLVRNRRRYREVGGSGAAQAPDSPSFNDLEQDSLPSRARYILPPFPTGERRFQAAKMVSKVQVHEGPAFQGRSNRTCPGTV
ncbi:hypothetical protein VTJ04DRAFT_529 [Mycothermus thermophilus]|uniref:uncharacterized protein n=1 Tax=Humicola insolens TaxID=85995 RepID=UPI0037442A49